jgi:hypothetical protein
LNPLVEGLNSAPPKDNEDVGFFTADSSLLLSALAILGFNSNGLVMLESF